MKIIPAIPQGIFLQKNRPANCRHTWSPCDGRTLASNQHSSISVINTEKDENHLHIGKEV